MLHHYLQKGHSLSYLLNVGPTERLFLFASMEKSFEEERIKYEAMFGGAK